MLYSVYESNFFTEEYSLNNIVFLTDSLDAAIKFCKKEYDVDLELYDEIMYSNDEDDELGERYVGIEEVQLGKRLL